MICILCLDESKKYISIFHGEGVDHNIQDIIAKHFWFQAKEDDPAANSICISCWLKLDAFHTFYLSVEEAHRNFVDRSDEISFQFKAGQHPSEFLFANDADRLPTKIETDLETEGIYDKLEIVELKEEFDLPTEGNLLEKDLVDANLKFDERPQNDPIKSEVNIEEEIDRDDEQVPRTRYERAAKKCESVRQSEILTETEKIEPVDRKEEILSSIEEDANDSEQDESPGEDECKGMPSVISRPKRGRPRKRGLSPVLRKPEKCENKKCVTSKEFDALIAQHMKLQCAICAVALVDFNELKKHYRSEHNIRGYAVCCEKKFLKRGVLADHINFHLNPEYFKCQECGRALADRRCLEVHMITHNVDKYKIHQCDECPKKFHKIGLLKRHKFTHTPEEQKKFLCNDCGKSFSSSYTLKYHQDNVHDKVYGKMCDICGRTLKGIEALRRHLLEHDGISQPEVQCEKCGAKMKHKYSLKRHMRTMHLEGDHTVICDICGKTTANPNALKRHHHYVHKYERQYRCTLCEKGFKKNYQLKEHMAIHTGEVLYTCPHCPKTFNSNANMHSHRKKVHRKEWEENRRYVRAKDALTTN